MIVATMEVRQWQQRTKARLLMLQAMGGQAIAAASKYVSLFDGQPSVSGTEVTGTGYARLARTAAQISVNNNILSVTMGEWDDSADVSWGTPTWVGFHTALTGGTLLFEAQISPGLTEIVAGTRVFTNAGDVELTVPPGVRRPL